MCFLLITWIMKFSNEFHKAILYFVRFLQGGAWKKKVHYVSTCFDMFKFQVRKKKLVQSNILLAQFKLSKKLIWNTYNIKYIPIHKAGWSKSIFQLDIFSKQSMINDHIASLSLSPFTYYRHIANDEALGIRLEAILMK